MKALALALLLPLPAAAQDVGQDDPGAPAAIESVIRDQLADFNARDVAGAWEEASPLIQGLFGSAENFGAMVERGYPMVWTNRDARFGELREEGAGLRQRVLVRDEAGRLWSLDYDMIELPEGWRINGVQVLPADEVMS